MRISKSDWISGSSPVGSSTDVKVSYEVFQYCNADYLGFTEPLISYVWERLSIPGAAQIYPNCQAGNGGNGACNSGCNLLNPKLKAFFCNYMTVGQNGIPEVPSGQYQVIAKYLLPTKNYGSEAQIAVQK